MPQLPSGLRVGLSAEPALETARSGDYHFHLLFKTTDALHQDLSPAISIVYFEPAEDCPDLGEPRYSELMLSDIGTDKCDWSAEDIAAFRAEMLGAGQIGMPYQGLAPSAVTGTCGSKTKCAQMTSCQEAMFYLNKCGLSRLDGDGDGKPCENLCR